MEGLNYEAIKKNSSSIRHFLHIFKSIQNYERMPKKQMDA